MMRKSVNKNKIMSVIKDSKILRATWHQYLNYIEDLSLNNMSKNLRIVRLDLQELMKTSLYLCDVCMRANQKKKILRKLQNWVIKIIKLIHINIVSLITSKVYDRFLWYIVFTDDLICWQYICNIKMKGQAKDEIEQFLNMLFI